MAAQQGNDQAWVKIPRTGQDGPKLVLTVAGGERVLEPTGEAQVIEYLADRAFPALPELAADRGDRNRALFQFELPEDSVEQAEFVFHVLPGDIAPRVPIAVAVHAIVDPWKPPLTWNDQPSFDPSFRAHAQLPTEAGEVSVDVTELLRARLEAGEPFHGLVIRANRRFSASVVSRRLVETVGWERDVGVALERSKAERKPVLAYISPHGEPGKAGFFEELLTAQILVLPEVLSRIHESFVPLRVKTEPMQHLYGHAAEDLERLGLKADEIGPPALIVVDAKGKIRAKLERLAACDGALVNQFLDRAGAKKARNPPTADAGVQGPFHRALAAASEGDRNRAEELFLAVAGDDPKTPLSLSAAAWICWPDRMLDYHVAVPSELPRKADSSEVAATKRGLEDLVERALHGLLRRQAPNGSFAHAQDESYRGAITALAARALLAWRDSGDEELRTAIDEALLAADDWLTNWIATEDPAGANSFSTAYALEYLVARAEDRTDLQPHVERAVTFLFGGQCQHGGWSYDQRFGDGWRGGFGGWPETDQGREHSMNTSLSLWALACARDAGFEVDEALLERGIDAMEAMATGPAAYTYTYPVPISFESADQSLARAPMADHALLLLGARTHEDLERSVEIFCDGRRDFRVTTKVTAGWIGPHNTSNYFHLFAYYHGARAIEELGGAKWDRMLAALRDDLLEVVECDATWVDMHESGKAYGTAMGLLVLAMAE